MTVGGVEFGNESVATVSAWCGNGDDAKLVHRTIQSVIPLGQNMLAGQKSQLPKMPEGMRGQLSAMIAFMEKLLDGVKVETTTTDDDGAVVTLQVETDLAAVPMMVSLTVSALQSARSAARRTQSMNNMKQLGLAMHNYHNVHKEFPAAVMTAEDGKTKYSWRVALLPYLDQENLYDAYNFEESWDSPDNKKILAAMPNTYRHPSEDAGVTNSSYYALIGKDTAWGEGDRAIKIRDLVDGTSNTALFFDAKRPIPWTKPEDIKYSADEDVPALGGYEAFGFIGALADGSVRYFMRDIDKQTLRAIITRNGNDFIDLRAIPQNPPGDRPIRRFNAPRID